jgi:hypothetical protein
MLYSLSQIMIAGPVELVQFKALNIHTPSMYVPKWESLSPIRICAYKSATAATLGEHSATAKSRQPLHNMQSAAEPLRAKIAQLLALLVLEVLIRSLAG